MKCPHCDETLPFVLCPDCKGECPPKSSYCCWCGRPMKKEEEEETEISQRILCNDGTCIGVINEKGVCNVCGKPMDGKPV
jgi:hypothetical protein